MKAVSGGGRVMNTAGAVLFRDDDAAISAECGRALVAL
jgi:hypothetical protein